MSINFGVIGAGRMGKIHAKNLSNFHHSQLIGIADIDEEKLEEIRSTINPTYCTTNYTKLLEDHNIDAVVVSSPAQTHEEIVTSSIKSGKHVFCEKPIALSIKKAQKIDTLVKESDKFFQVGFMRRFDRGYRAGKRILSEGKIGTPILAISQTISPETYQGTPSEVGDLTDKFCSHDIDSLEWLLQSKIKKIFGFGNQLTTSKEEGSVMDAVGSVLRFENGAIGMINAAMNAGWGDIKVRVVGEKGTIEIKEKRNHTAYKKDQNTIRFGTYKDSFERFACAFKNEMEYFIDCIQNNENPSPGAREGLRAVRVATEMNKSIKENKAVTL